MSKFPFYKQFDAKDCGPTCLRMIAKYYGKSYSQYTMYEKCNVTREGVSLLGISRAAESIGFRTQGVKPTWKQVLEEIQLPCIVHWQQNHFVVLYKIKRQGIHSRNNVVCVADPEEGLLEYSVPEFLSMWLSTEDNGEKKGVALTLEPTPQFYEEEGEKEKKLKFGYLLKYLRPYKRHIAQILMGMLVGSVISLIFPFLTQSIVDYGINNNNINFVLMILVAQLALAFGQTANDLIRSWIMLHMTVRISISFISDFLSKLMRLPISFFDTKMVGDIMQRIGDNSRIQSFLTGSLLSIAIAVITLIVYTIVMAGYNLTILGIFMLGSVLYLLWIVLFLKYRRQLDYKQFRQSAINQSNVIQLISGMQEIKLNNCEQQKRWEWERIQAKLYKLSIQSMSLEQTQMVGGFFINQTKNIIISFIAAKAVIEGDMTLGMMMAMQYILGQINAPIMQFIGFTQAAQDAKISVERLGEIYDREDEEPSDSNMISDIDTDKDILFKNVSFNYVENIPVLENIDIRIEAGKITAIVGESGTGKTTLLKMILGFYPPKQGEILLGTTDLSTYSPSAWRNNCGVVMQEGFIFSDSILNNITVSEETPDKERFRYATQVANISDFIKGLPNGYNTKIGAEGNGLSSGQKQRMLIARAVYKNPSYIIFDEATNSLDSSNERIIMDNLNSFYKGKTVIIVAHRLSTVKNADKIIVLYKGKVAETGTHEELVAKREMYYDLVKNQLELGN